MDEDTLISTLFSPLATDAGADGLGDDAAAFAGGPGDVVVTCDALAAGVHFFPDDPPEAIAAKALRVNLSDLAAKGAEPFGYLVALALPPSCDGAWVRAFARGLADDQAQYGVSLLGGDTLRASPGGGATITVTAFGRTGPGRTVRRRSARPGDAIVVTGTIGDAALGLQMRLGTRWEIAEAHAATLRSAYLYPDPPVRAWPAVRRWASAAMDVSDGLIGDLAKLCRTAGVGARLDLDAVPLSNAARAVVDLDPAAFDRAVTGGDDYQILATMPAAAVSGYVETLRQSGIEAVQIGAIVAGSPDVQPVRGGTAAHVSDGRFQHF